MFHLLSHPRYQEVSKSQEKPAVLLILEYAKQSEVPLSLQYRCLTNTESSFLSLFSHMVLLLFRAAMGSAYCLYQQRKQSSNTWVSKL